MFKVLFHVLKLHYIQQLHITTDIQLFYKNKIVKPINTHIAWVQNIQALT